MENTIKPPFEVHPLAETLPLMTDDEFQSLYEDIKKNGQKVKIVVHNGKIIDGRNRDMVCTALGIEPEWEEWDQQGSLIDFIVSMNLERRMLDVEQKGLAAARLTNMRRGYNRPEAAAAAADGDDDENSPGSNPSQEGLVSQADAAKIFNVSVSSIQRAKNILKNGVSEVIEAVESGELTLVEADRIVKAIPRTKQKREIRKGRQTLKELANKLLVSQVKQNHEKTGTACLICDREAEITDEAFMTHLVALMRRVPSKRRYIEDILNEMSEAEFVDEIADASEKILVAIDAGHREKAQMKKMSGLDWEIFNAALANMLEYKTVEAYTQEGKSEMARGQKKTLYRRRIKPVKEEAAGKVAADNSFEKPAGLSSSKIQAKILAAVDDWVCQLPRIKKHAGIPAGQDLTDILDEMLDEEILVQRNNGTITCFFRPDRVPAKFWSTGADRISFEMAEIIIPPEVLDLTSENNLAF